MRERETHTHTHWSKYSAPGNARVGCGILTENLDYFLCRYFEIFQLSFVALTTNTIMTKTPVNKCEFSQSLVTLSQFVESFY